MKSFMGRIWAKWVVDEISRPSNKTFRKMVAIGKIREQPFWDSRFECCRDKIRVHIPTEYREAGKP